MRELFESLGKWAGRVVSSTGGMTLMLIQAVLWIFVPPLKLRNIFRQMEFVGVNSLFVVILTGAFTGAVLALQSYNALKRFGAESLVGPTVA
ncbi:MAG: ABC transporter permease, partial [Deltaproteobacteria bacterium]